MKTLTLLAALLFLAAPGFAQQPDNTTPPELAKVRQKYVDSLNDLLQQYTKANNAAGMKAVTLEIDKFSPCGVWMWDEKIKTVTLHDDGTVTQNSKTADKNSKDAWHWTDQASGKFTIVWDSGLVDAAILSPDGKTMLIRRNTGTAFVARRLPQVEPDAGAHAN